MIPDAATPVHTYRVDDFAAYFRLIRNRLEATSLRDQALLAAENYPEPVDHCEICRWQRDCDKKRRRDDHLSLVAGMRKLQAREFELAGVNTLASLGGLSLPLPSGPAAAPWKRTFVCGNRRVSSLRDVLKMSPSTSCFCQLTKARGLLSASPVRRRRVPRS